MNDTVSNVSIASSHSTSYTNAFAQRTPPVEETQGNSSEIRCICGFDEDDGFTIQCDKCDKWQHGVCLRMSTVKDVPEQFICHFCNPQGPVDIKRAQEMQRKRRERESRSHKKKTGGTSNRRKEILGSSHNNKNGVDHLQLSDKSNDRKPSSPKDQNPGKPKARQRTNNGNNTLPDTAFSPVQTSPSENSTGAEGDIDSESEVPPSIYTKEYNPVSSSSPLSSNVETKLKANVLESEIFQQNKPINGGSLTIKHYSGETYSRIASLPICVRRVSGSGRSSVGAPLNYITLETSKRSGTFIMEFIGEIGLKSSYVSDSLNQYHIIRHPKPFVVFHPILPFYIDARQCGSESRFARRSCKPNLTLGTVVIDNFDIRFGLFATEDIDAGTELTIGWEWDSSLSSLPAVAAGKIEPSAVEATKMTAWAETVTANLGECACADKQTCLLERFHDESFSNSGGKVVRANKKMNGKRRRNVSVDLPGVVVKDVSPEYVSGNEQSNQRSSPSSSSREKPSSRDRTPSHPPQESGTMTNGVDHAESAREARKIKETISLIEKLSSQDPQSRKRIKRPSAGSTSLISSALFRSEDVKPENTTSLESPSLAINGQGHSSPRSESSSPTNHVLNDEKTSAQSVHVSHTQSSTIVGDVQRKARAVYCEVSTQTDTDDLPIFSIKPVLTRKKRILAAFRAQQTQIEKSVKPMLTIVKEEPSPTEINVAQDEDALMTGVKPDLESYPHILTENSSINSVDPNTVKHLSYDHYPCNQLDDSIPQFDHLNGAVNIFKSPPLPHASPPSKPNAQSNGYRMTDLHIQMPPTPSFPNAPTTPALSNTVSSIDPNITGFIVQSPIVSMPSLPSMPSLSSQASLDLAFSPSLQFSMPTPAKKKMSLSEYGKRRKAETSEKGKEKLAAVAAVAMPFEDTSPTMTGTSSLEHDRTSTSVTSEGEPTNGVTPLSKDFVPMELDTPATTIPATLNDDEMQGVSTIV